MSCSKQKTGLNTSSEQVDGKCCHHGNDSNQLHDECQSKSVVDLTTIFFVFGYGGLLWKNSDLNFFAKIPGYIKGYARRFWQMNQFHRGTDENVISSDIIFVSQRITYFIFFKLLQYHRYSFLKKNQVNQMNIYVYALIGEFTFY